MPAERNWTTTNRLQAHVVLKAVCSYLLTVVLQAVAILLGFALRENGTALVLTLLFVHVAEILSFSALTLFVVLYHKKKGKGHTLLLIFYMVLIALLLVGLSLESFLIAG